MGDCGLQIAEWRFRIREAISCQPFTVRAHPSPKLDTRWEVRHVQGNATHKEAPHKE